MKIIKNKEISSISVLFWTNPETFDGDGIPVVHSATQTSPVFLEKTFGAVIDLQSEEKQALPRRYTGIGSLMNYSTQKKYQKLASICRFTSPA